ncbi:MAG: DNA mismatch repair endonuclease MutL [Clostridia bacterium]|nr:DNA mismatch repair endonuclease MutL [Clostridia bacterium]
MPEINVLPKSIAELIAAGEVVERPASVVKELMENAVDAGADKITIEIQRGGISSIRITDNGCGIDRNNVRKAFVSHATSKISGAEDLNSIYTLGFRGEALASIAAVSRVEMMTRTASEQIGTRYVIEGGEEVLIDDAGCPVGTVIIVRDLFYNTPARMKFLKKDVSEANAVAGVVDRIALSHPEISVRFIRDGKSVLLTSGDSKLKSAVYSVFGRDFSDTLLPADYELDGVRVSGFISKPFNSRPNRSMQFFFLNNRYIRTGTGIAALEEAYKNQIMVGKFPACVLNISIPAQAVDVNVHPAKTEVRFENEKRIFNAVYYCAVSALNGDTQRVHADFKSGFAKNFMPEPHKGKQLRIYERQLESASKQDFWKHESAESFRSDDKPEKTAVTFNNPVKVSRLDDFPDLLDKARPKPVNSEPEEDKAPVEAEPAVEQKTAQEDVPVQIEPFRVIGEAFRTYIIVQQGEKLLIVDKHAAHERMLFEKFKANRGSIETQIMLTPVTVTLGKEDYAAVLENTDVLSEAGYAVEDFGGGTVVVSECPTAVADADIGSVIMELAGCLAENRTQLVPEKLDWIYHSTACRAAIKAGDSTTDHELDAFVKELLENPDIRYCPHGRPVLIELTRRDIEKNFGR